ncbi:E3 ubiquitin-protein ligase MARCHF2-like [Haemaphysalis longicornis]
MEFSGHDSIQRHQSLPETTSARRNVSSTPKRSHGDGCDAECRTDPVPRKRPSRISLLDRGPTAVTPEANLPTPIRSRASPVGIATLFSGEAKRSSLVLSGHHWSWENSSRERVSRPLSLACSSGPICRICHEGDQAGPLSSYCACTGTMGLLHSLCLQRWLSASNADSCELCHERFPTIRLRRGFSEWFRGPGDQRRAVCADVVCFILLSPIAGLGLEMCVQSATAHSTTRRVIQVGSLVTLSVLLIAAFLIWTYFTVRYHYRRFRQWQEDNVRVVLVPRSVCLGDVEAGLH